MTTRTAAAPGDEFAALLDTLTQVSTENTNMAKAMAADSDFEMDEEGKPKMGADGKPVRKTMKKDETMDPAMAGDGGMMGKAFSATLGDGTLVEGIDATEMLKALDGDMGVLRKALPGLVGALRVQGNLIKALQGDLATLRGNGTGRRAMVNVHDRPALTAPQEQDVAGKVTPGAFMAKALDAARDGLITGLDVAKLEAGLNRGIQPSADLAATILNHKKG